MTELLYILLKGPSKNDLLYHWKERLNQYICCLDGLPKTTLYTIGRIDRITLYAILLRWPSSLSYTAIQDTLTLKFATVIQLLPQDIRYITINIFRTQSLLGLPQLHSFLGHTHTLVCPSYISVQDINKPRLVSVIHLHRTLSNQSVPQLYCFLGQTHTLVSLSYIGHKQTQVSPSQKAL